MSPIAQPQASDANLSHASLMPGLQQRMLKELNRTPAPEAAAVEWAALQVLKGSQDILASFTAAPTPGSSTSASVFACHPDDLEYHCAVSGILRRPEEYPQMTSGATAAVLEAYGNLAAAGGEAMVQELAKVEGLVEGLMCAAEYGSPAVQAHGVFLLSQLAIAGPDTAMQIALLPGLAEECCRAISSGSKSERVPLNWALLVNNVAAMGGEEAARALTAHSMLVRELGAWLDSAHEAATLQRLTGVFNHLSRSKESARVLQDHGIMDALGRLVSRTGASGSADAREAYVGLANMAMANIAASQDAVCAAESSGRQRESKSKGGSVRFKVSSIKSIVGFLRCAVEGQQTSGIRFRVYDVLYALDSLCQCHERDLLGIECGLVDVAVQVTAEWRPGKYSSIFTDAKASTYPVLEVSTDILVHLAQSQACKARMRELYLESILDRLLLTAEGRVRDHVLKVLWVLRDEKEARKSAKKIVAQVDSLRQLSAKYDCGGQGLGGQGDMSGLLQGAVGDGNLDEDLQASVAWIKSSDQISSYLEAENVHLVRESGAKHKHQRQLHMQLAALGEEVEALQHSVAMLSAEKAELAQNVQKKDDVIEELQQSLHDVAAVVCVSPRALHAASCQCAVAINSL